MLMHPLYYTQNKKIQHIHIAKKSYYVIIELVSCKEIKLFFGGNLVSVLLFILVALLTAKIKRYQVLCIFKTYDLYPLFLVELVYIFFQINVFFDNYSYVQYASQIQMAYIVVLLVPIIRRKLYAPALIGSGMMALGSILNHIVIAANDGHMPVLPTLSRLTHYYRDDALLQRIDSFHILMTDATKMNILGDYIDIGYSIMSIGDLFIHAFVAVIVYYTVKSINQSTNKVKT